MDASANKDQWKAWDGDEGDDWTDAEDWYNDSGRYLRPHLTGAAAVAATERVLDIGCGTGLATRAAARAAREGSALGVDLSSRMLARARERAAEESLTNVSFLQADAQVHSFEPAAFDVVISSYGAMFFEDRAAAFANIATAVRSGGRLAILAWQELAKNEWLSEILTAFSAGRDMPRPPAGAPGPFGLADHDGVRTTLTAAGFADVDLQEIDEPIYLGANPGVAFEQMSNSGIARGFLSGLDDPTREKALDDLRARFESHADAEGVRMASRSWLITARRA